MHTKVQSAILLIFFIVGISLIFKPQSNQSNSPQTQFNVLPASTDPDQQKADSFFKILKLPIFSLGDPNNDGNLPRDVIAPPAIPPVVPPAAPPGVPLPLPNIPGGWPFGDTNQCYNGGPNVGTHNCAANPLMLCVWENYNAIDLNAPVGTPVYAVDAGTISSPFGPSSTGNRLHLATADNSWYYGHLDGFAPGIDIGTVVTKGQLIAYSGFYAAAHLHIAAKEGHACELLQITSRSLPICGTAQLAVCP